MLRWPPTTKSIINSCCVYADTYVYIDTHIPECTYMTTYTNTYRSRQHIPLYADVDRYVSHSYRHLVPSIALRRRENTNQEQVEEFTRGTTSQQHARARVQWKHALCLDFLNIELHQRTGEYSISTLKQTYMIIYINMENEYDHKYTHTLDLYMWSFFVFSV